VIIRPPLDLDRDHSPAHHRPQLPGRLGIGPAAARNYEAGPWQERWSESIILELHRGSSGYENVASPWIHQPFMIRQMHLTETLNNPGGMQYRVLVTQGEVLASEGAQRAEWGIPRGTPAPGEDNIPRTELVGAGIAPGTVFWRVPAKIFVLCYITTAATVYCQWVFDITYLARVCHRSSPDQDSQTQQLEPSG